MVEIRRQAFLLRSLNSKMLTIQLLLLLLTSWKFNFSLAKYFPTLDLPFSITKISLYNNSNTECFVRRRNLNCCFVNRTPRGMHAFCVWLAGGMSMMTLFQGQKHGFFCAWIPHNSVKLSCSICFSLATVCRSLQITLNMFSTGFNSADLGGSLTISALAHSQVILAALEFWQGSVSWMNSLVFAFSELRNICSKLVVNERGKKFSR